MLRHRQSATLAPAGRCSLIPLPPLLWPLPRPLAARSCPIPKAWWRELGELADIPGIQAICGILSPPGPMMLDMTGPKEMAKCPLCPACLHAYADPPGMTPLENHYFGYAIPTTPAPAPALETEAQADAPVEPLTPAR